MKRIDWMKARPLYALISGLVITIGIFSFMKWGFNLGVDFKGGTLIDYKFEKSVQQDSLSAQIEKLGVTVQSVQSTGRGSFLLRLGTVDTNKKQEIQKKLEEISGGKVEELRYEDVGPSIGGELIKKTAMALLIATSAILLWIAYQFKSIKLGVCATLATFHDSLVVLGLFAFFGHFFGAEIDFLFITALLTVLSFSVHDTIVVYDRIREIRRKQGGQVYDIANEALTETMRRSVNNSLTIIFMLVALVILGGVTIRWFAVALLVGTISGTYSSPFVAVPILVTWEEIAKRFRKK
jgi:preprotein translocase subunit SecF